MRRILASITAVVMLATAACGDDDDSADTTDAPAAVTEGPAATTADSAAGASEGGATLDEAVKFVFLAETKGESENGIPDFADGAQMAVDEINAAGGIGGQPLEYVRIPFPPVDVNGANAALRRALDEEPTILMGFTSNTTAVPLIPDVVSSGVATMVTYGQGEWNFGSGHDSEVIFQMRPGNIPQDIALIKWLNEEKKPTKVALLCIDVPEQIRACDQNRERFTDAGVEVVAHEVYALTATDLTAQVLAIGRAEPDLVYVNPFPNSLAIFMKQMVEQGFEIPVYTGASAYIVAQTGGLTGPALTLLTGIEMCMPALDDRPLALDWATKFEDTYGYGGGSFSALSYDSIMLGKAAIEAAGSTDPAAIATALEELRVESVCDPEIMSNEYHVLEDHSVIVNWDSSGQPSVIGEVQLEPSEF